MLAASRVRAMHARVRGTLPGGVEYAADDPQLLAWVHCCLVASFLEVLTRGGVALTGAEQDQYIEEQVKAAMLVGLEPDEVPHDRAALLDYFRVIKPALECTPAARRTASELVAPPAAASRWTPLPRPAPPGRRWQAWPSRRCRRGGAASTPCPSCPGPRDFPTPPRRSACAACARRCAGPGRSCRPLREGPHLQAPRSARAPTRGVPAPGPAAPESGPGVGSTASQGLALRCRRPALRAHPPGSRTTNTIDDGRAGNAACPVSPCAYASSAARASRAIDSASATLRCEAPAAVGSRRRPLPLGRWCSSTRAQGRRSVRAAATAYTRQREAAAARRRR